MMVVVDGGDVNMNNEVVILVVLPWIAIGYSRQPGSSE
jgi:hypothetical protein